MKNVLRILTACSIGFLINLEIPPVSIPAHPLNLALASSSSPLLHSPNGFKESAPYDQLSSEWSLGPDGLPGGVGGPWGANSASISLGPVVGNVSGHGKADVVYWVPIQGYKVLTSDGTTLTEQPTFTGVNAYNQDLGPYLADVNGDGLCDVVYWKSGVGFRILVSTGTSFGTDLQWGANMVPFSKGPFLADVNGDGMADVVYYVSGSGYRVLKGGLNSQQNPQLGTDTLWSTNKNTYSQDLGPWIADFDGDGKADVLYWNAVQGFRFLRSIIQTNGTLSLLPDAPWPGNLGMTPSKGPFVADVNGDGKADLVYWVPYIGYRVLPSLSGGNSFGPDSTWGSNRKNQDLGPFFGDVTGDHRADVIYWTAGEGFHVLPSNHQSIETRGQQLWESATVVFAHHHCNSNNPSNTNLQVLKQAGVTAVVALLTVDGLNWTYAPPAPPTPGKWTSNQPPSGYSDQMSYGAFTANYSTIAGFQSQGIVIVKSKNDFATLKAAGNLGVIIGSEGASQLDFDNQGNPQHMKAEVMALAGDRTSYPDGCNWRQTALRWQAGDGNDPYRTNLLWQLSQDFYGYFDALSPAGVTVLTQINSSGVVIDLSHIVSGGAPNHQFISSFNNVMGYVAGFNPSPPVIISHDNPIDYGGFCTDDMIHKVADSGGGFGVYCLDLNNGSPGGHGVLYNPQLAQFHPLFTLAMSAEYVINLVGESHVGLGPDYIDDLLTYAVQPDYIDIDGNSKAVSDNSYPQNSPSLALSQIAKALVHRGLTDKEITDILGGNLVTLYQKVWKQ